MLGPFCQGIFVVRFVVQFIVPQIVPQIMQKPPQKGGTISEVFAQFFAWFENTPPRYYESGNNWEKFSIVTQLVVGVDYRENIQFQEMDITLQLKKLGKL